jgi:hypothetical protein
MQLPLLALLATTFLAGPAPDKSSCEGTIRVNSTPVELKHVRVHLYDNAEGLATRKKELRILLTDREVPASSIYGTAFPPVWHMAMEGKVQGVLLELDPSDPNNINTILLMKPKQKGRSLMTMSISESGGKVFEGWKYGGGRVSGALKRGKEGNSADEDLPNIVYAVKFDAAVDPGPPVTQDLTGAKALASPQVKVLAQAADAMSKADFAALKNLSSAAGKVQIDEMIAMTGPQAKQSAKQSGTELKAMVKKVKRVVVRGDRATVLMPDGLSVSMVLEGGTWKMNN